MRDACDLMLQATDDLLRVLVRLAREHRNTVMIGRTHGIHAEPATFGAKVALWALQVDRDRERQHGAAVGLLGRQQRPEAERQRRRTRTALAPVRRAVEQLQKASPTLTVPVADC